MEDHVVTLSILPDRNGLFKFISDIRIFNGTSEWSKQVIQNENKNESKVFLGTLNELKDSYLIVDTFAQKFNANLDNYFAKVSYEIKYGQTIVEKKTLESHSMDKLIKFPPFRFHFCPRYPFC